MRIDGDKLYSTGAEVADFYNNGWPRNYYHDDYELDICDANGDFSLIPTTEYDLDELGVLIWQEDHEPKSSQLMWPFKDAMKQWVESQEHSDDPRFPTVYASSFLESATLEKLAEALELPVDFVARKLARYMMKL